MKKIILLLLLLLSNNLLSQVRIMRDQDLSFQNHLYRVIKIPIMVNGDPDGWKIWMLDDLIPYDKNHILDMETQSGQKGIGVFLNGAFDSLKINYEGALKSCPTGWRLPRIGEWDTLLNTLDYQQRVLFFNKLKGFKGFKSDTINGKILRKETIINGGFYWSLTSDEHKAWGIEIETNFNVNKGKADKADFLSVRCIKEEEFEE